MTDPRRWADAGNAATQGEQALVRAGQDLPMPAHEKHEIWNRILAALPGTIDPVPTDGHAPVPLAAKVTATGASGTLWVLTGAKILGVLAAVSGIVGGYHWMKKSGPSVSPQASRTVATATLLPVASGTYEPLPQTESSSSGVETPTPAPTATTMPLPTHASQLREESLAVMAARQALRSNDAGKALHLLEEARQRFKRGVLIEEREALTIEALARTGQTERASARAQAFANRYPRSPHAADVQRFIAK